MAEPLFLLSPERKPSRFGSVARTISTSDEVREAFVRHRRARWVVERPAALQLLAGAGTTAPDTWRRLLVLAEPSPNRLQFLRGLFRDVITRQEGVHLRADELVEIFATENPEDLFIGGVVDSEDDVLVLFRGNLERMLVPLEWFRRDRHPKPNFDDFEVIDTGQTLRFGEYEAAADALLYEFDAGARRRMKERERAQDRSFGGALRRLRLQKGLSRSDFPGIDPKTVARIERGEVEKPREETLSILARSLGVEPEDIETF